MKSVFVKTIGAAAHQSGAMGAGTHFKTAMGTETILKNGAGLKSQMSRGNFLRKACFALLVAGIFFATDVSAQQQKGDMAAGVNLGLLLNEGFGAKFQYVTSEKIRLQGSFNYYISLLENSNNRWGFDVDMHYMFSTKKIAPYFVLGLGVLGGVKGSLDEDGELGVDIDTMPAFDLGGGLDIGIGKNLAFNLELKIRLVAMLQAGLVYRF